MTTIAAPWTIVETESAAIGERAILDADGYTVCNPSPMGAANAALIAAAPELLEALLACVEPVAEGEDCPLPPSLYNKVCAAIQKATGG